MYTVDYFIKKFEEIPEENWVIGEFRNDNGCCAQGHCGMNSFNANHVWDNHDVSNTPTHLHEAHALFWMFKSILCIGVADVNNFESEEYPQPTPKQRVLAALCDIKKLQQPKEGEIKTEQTFVPISYTKIIDEILVSAQ